MEQTFLSNERIYLRAMEPEDVEILYETENDPAMWEVSSTTAPYSRYVLKQFIGNSHNDIFTDKQLRLMIVRKADNRVAGTIDITDFAPMHARGAVGIAILENFRQSGYAADALSLLCRYAFRFLHMKQLYACIPRNNEPSLKLFLSCGFRECGVLREWLRTENGHTDAVLMQCLDDGC